MSFGAWGLSASSIYSNLYGKILLRKRKEKMNKTLRSILIVVTVIVIGAALFLGGAAFGFMGRGILSYGSAWMMSNIRSEDFNNPGSSQAANGYGMGGMMNSGLLGRRGMMGNATQNDGWEWMNAMHQWMTVSGGMHTRVWNTLAEKLGLSSDELYTELNNGKTLDQVAEAKSVSRADLVATLETAHQASLAQAVRDGDLTQAQADTILAQMAGRYEWMLDNMASGGMMNGQNGFGGMMGGMMNGQFAPGGCPGDGTGNGPAQSPKP